MAPFELLQPASLREAIAALDADDPTVRPIAGGTALMLLMKAGVLRPKRLVRLDRLGLEGVAIGPQSELRIGAMTRLADLERSALVRASWPVIAGALRTLANVRVRNVARVGGHLAHADPHMDLPPILTALDARVTVVGPDGARTLPVAALSTGYFETAMARNELITLLEVPPLRGRRAAYLKCTTRSADDWPALGVAVVLDMDGDVSRAATLVLSAATDKPTRLRAAEEALRGARLDDVALRRACEAAVGEAAIAADAHGSVAYKQQLLRVYLARVIREARDRAH